ncbi:nitroreductase family protein, partial [Adlercreutzia equolifaciens]
ANLNIQLVLDEPRAFTGFKARLVNFTNVRNYLALVGPECKELDGIVGYYGEQLVLLAQSLGLNSCWVGGTYKVVNRAYNVDLGQKLAAVVALGYGATQGVPHRSKAPQEVAPGYDGAPEWFKRGVDAALLAPTALNQQKFSFALADEEDVPMVRASTRRGAFTQMDLGIAQCHFEIGAGNALYRWAE